MLFYQKYNTILFSVLFAGIFNSPYLSQNILDYIPYEEKSLKTHPIITLKTTLHLVYKSESDPQNITLDSIQFIEQQYKWVNNAYKNMKPPTLLPKNGETYYVPDSRIRFRLDTIICHYDSVAWDRIYNGVVMSGGAPWKIDSVNLEKNLISVKGKRESILRSRGDSVVIGGSSGNDGVYHTESFYSDDKNTYILLKEALSVDIVDGNVTYFTKIDKNCHKDNWENLTNSDKNSIHIFYTGSTIPKPAFGCGPSPYFLNVSRVLFNGAFATAQLTAHELGHCLGLRHTNIPQFDDLPSSDKFGWINCNKTNTSNNIMGYNLCRNYLSPKQIGYIHKRFTSDPALTRITANGEYDAEKNIFISVDENWEKAMLISGDIIVRSGKTLRIKGNVSMAENANIYLEKKAKIIIDGAQIANNHGEKWGSIIVCKSYFRKNKKPCWKKNYGITEIINDGVLRDGRDKN